MNREFRKMGRLIRQNVLVQGSLFVILLMIVLAITAPILPLKDPAEQDLMVTLQPPSFTFGESTHFLGTDYLGRDVLSRIVWGSRISLLVGFSVVAIALLIGVTAGLVASYFGGALEESVMRVVDVVLSIPQVLIAIAVLALFGQSLLILILVLGFRTSVWYARTIRSRVLSVKQEHYVSAARAMGAAHTDIMLRHILPNSIAPIIVLSTVYIGLIIIIESGLSFLGLTKVHISWGWMIAESRDYLATSWWAATFPGLFLFATVFSINILGDLLRDTFDPSVSTEA
jgi:peptide/nickel transport system permease protein